MTAPMISAGVPLAKARTAVIMLHGRGGSAQDILSLGQEFDTGDIAFVAPQAPGAAGIPFPSWRQSPRTSRFCQRRWRPLEQR